MKVFIKVHPNSKTESVTKRDDGGLDVRVKAPATEGKANKAVIAVLSKYFDVPKSLISIKVGQASKSKIIEIS